MPKKKTGISLPETLEEYCGYDPTKADRVTRDVCRALLTALVERGEFRLDGFLHLRATGVAARGVAARADERLATLVHKKREGE